MRATHEELIEPVVSGTARVRDESSQGDWQSCLVDFELSVRRLRNDGLRLELRQMLV